MPLPPTAPTSNSIALAVARRAGGTTRLKAA
jgi:hypothetical protein